MSNETIPDQNLFEALNSGFINKGTSVLFAKYFLPENLQDLTISRLVREIQNHNNGTIREFVANNLKAPYSFDLVRGIANLFDSMNIDYYELVPGFKHEPPPNTKFTAEMHPDTVMYILQEDKSRFNHYIKRGIATKALKIVLRTSHELANRQQIDFETIDTLSRLREFMLNNSRHFEDINDFGPQKKSVINSIFKEANLEEIFDIEP